MLKSFAVSHEEAISDHTQETTSTWPASSARLPPRTRQRSALPPLQGHPKLAAHIGNALFAEEFDLSFFQDKALDHGAFSPLSVLWPHEPAWPAPIVPLQVGVVQFPIPSAKRCYKLGQALRRAIESYPEDLRVVIIATGGLSHQVHGERAGFNNVAWDERFMDLLEKDPATLSEMTHAQLASAA